MIVFLSGPDDYRRERAKREHTSRFKMKYSDIGMAFFDLSEDGSSENFEIFIKSQSIFEPQKFAVLENLFENESEKLPEFLKNLADSKNITVLVSEKSSPDKNWQFLAVTARVSEKFEYLSGADWERFIKTEAAEEGLEFSEPALHFLTHLYANDTWRIVTEIKKIALSDKIVAAKAADKKAEVELSDLENYDFTPSLAGHFDWGLVMGLKNQRVENRLSAFQKLLSRGEPAQKLFHMIAYQWPDKLSYFAGADIAVKSGKLEYEEALLYALIS